MPSEQITHVIEIAAQYGRFFCKFISPNDVGLNANSHQEGIYIPNRAAPLFFPIAGLKGENKDHLIKVHVESTDRSVEARAIWYGNKTRREYRITRFWAHTEYDRYNQLGNLIIFVQATEDDFISFILDREEDIEDFLDAFSISLVQNNAVYGLQGNEIEETQETKLERAIRQYTEGSNDFPLSFEIALKAREFFYRILRGTLQKPDSALIKWIDIEYTIFRSFERVIYLDYLSEPFDELDKLIDFANSALNRRKSRAGKSLEHHASFILSEFGIPFSHPGKSEGNKKPDFILPSNTDYANVLYDEDKLVMLGAKTTCKDRWRQILNEADRIPVKHLLTLQQGITENQLKEMKDENVVLVVPKPYHSMYPAKYQECLLDLNTFLGQMREKYSYLV